MCGIAGIICADGRSPDRAVLDRMAAALTHRGPDGRGIMIDGPVGLAHTRLAIVDLEGGRQPMDSVSGKLTVCYNGEIFNHLELRQDLQSRGGRFASRCDTEVILEAYALEGESCVEKFNGQWAFALWDRRDQSLFLSRDRVGILPLYYTFVGGDFLFASEIKALLAHPGVSRELDPRGLDQLMTFWHPIPGQTVFRNIFELQPGHSMRVRDGAAKRWPYWAWTYDDVDAGMDEETCVGRLRELLIDATRIRLRADVPVGAYLSGGLDSSVLAGMVRKHTDAPLRTFSVAFDDAGFDESEHQQEVVRFLETDHSVVQCRRQDIARDFARVLWHAERPMLRTAPAPLMQLSGLVRQSGYKVVVTGEGADEVLGGYDIFKEAKIRRFWGEQPQSRRRPLLLRKLYPYLKDIQAQPEAYLKAFFHVRPEDLNDPFFSHLPRWGMTGGIKLFLSAAMRDSLRGYDCREEMRSHLPANFARWSPFHQAQHLEATGLLQGYLLSSQGDRMLMGNSIEGRFPYLDHRVMEFAATIPPRLKMKGLREKYALRKAAEGLAPPSVLNRVKQPYRAPDAVSFFDPANPGATPEYVEEMLEPGRVAKDGIFDAAAVGKLVAKARAGKATSARDNMALVGVLSTQLLVHQFINNPSLEGCPT
ncbi:MAG: asparagine synthase (glutamine-hydrolyzing) [Planctomycetota bacterium]|nr:asparagine synthase (glutamine-hydrolyzing) [Planctomycetota bacterium]